MIVYKSKLAKEFLSDKTKREKLKKELLNFMGKNKKKSSDSFKVEEKEYFLKEQS